MRIGIDFDNTLANYNGVFHRAAVEQGLIPADLAGDKTSVRDHLRATGRDADFTALQGHVYGTRMELVKLYPGAREALAELRAAGHDLFIVSHKTREPFAGPRYDLHAAARSFLDARGLMGEGALFAPDAVFFELTKEAKVARAAALGCDTFIDDLPEVLSLEGFPVGMRAILFDPDGHYPDGRWKGRVFERHHAWTDIGFALVGRNS
jgi:FMN phosphatase YigB (HAD superfamily)